MDRSVDPTVDAACDRPGPSASGVRVNAILPGGVVTGMTASVAMDLDKQGLSVKG
jgi:NAD(P)-dependent dehydrogenase (short-subunit alcohol dehydrogenase family)